MNGMTSKIIAGVIIFLITVFMSVLIGRATLDGRVTILETNYKHIKETMDNIHGKVDRLLEGR